MYKPKHHEHNIAICMIEDIAICMIKDIAICMIEDIAICMIEDSNMHDKRQQYA